MHALIVSGALTIVGTPIAGAMALSLAALVRELL